MPSCYRLKLKIYLSYITFMPPIFPGTPFPVPSRDQVQAGPVHRRFEASARQSRSAVQVATD